MAGIEYKRRKISEAKTEVPQLQEFRKRIIGPAAELLNLMANILSKPPFNYTGTDLSNNTIFAFALAAMRGDGALEFIVGDEIISLNISEKKLGNFAGLLSQLREWSEAADSGEAAEAAEASNPPQTKARNTPSASMNVERPALPPIAPALTDEERELVQSLGNEVQPEVSEVRDQAPDEVSAPASEVAADDAGDSKSQLHVEMDEAEEPVVASQEQPALDGNEGKEVPAQTKPKRAIPDFHARMRDGDKS